MITFGLINPESLSPLKIQQFFREKYFVLINFFSLLFLIKIICVQILHFLNFLFSLKFLFKYYCLIAIFHFWGKNSIRGNNVKNINVKNRKLLTSKTHFSFIFIFCNRINGKNLQSRALTKKVFLFLEAVFSI